MFDMHSLKKWLAIAKDFAPITLAALGVPDHIIGDVSTGILAAQKIEGASGTDKKVSVMKIASAALDAAGVPDFQKVTALEATSKGIDTTVALVGIAHAHAMNESKEPPTQ